MQHFKWTLIMSMLTLIFLIPAHGAKADAIVETAAKIGRAHV